MATRGKLQATGYELLAVFLRYTPTHIPTERCTAMRMWRNLRGPARMLASCATTLLFASALLGTEASIMLILGPARGIVIKPFILLGYVEACAMIISLLGIIAGIIGLIFYHPYHYISEKIYMYRAQRAAQVSDEHTHFEDV